ncbi:hypothetical protein [Cypionkella sinensis]|uniref:hypothetical protein n=1 Tax=Cypionkella sinensis TaxID=1756043 RepID=UPI0036328653
MRHDKADEPLEDAAEMPAAEMSAAEPDLSLEANLRRLAVLMRRWPGEAIDAALTLRLLNPQGDAVPVYWCFNAIAEFGPLADSFGPRQPLVGMRSLNQIVNVTPDTTFVLDTLAAYYAQALLARFGRAPCIVGGNCQAAGIAWRVANLLRAAGVPVERLVFLDAAPHLPWPGHVRLLFGALDTGFNPLLSPPDDLQHQVPWYWERAWNRFDTRIVSGGHGAYFFPENLPDVARAILDPDPVSAPAAGFADLVSASVATCRDLRCRVVHSDQQSSTLELVAPTDFSAIRGLAVMPLWQSPDGGLQGDQTSDWLVAVQTLPVWRHRFLHPPGLSHARLVPVPCLAGHGPLIWPPAEMGVGR